MCVVRKVHQSKEECISSVYSFPLWKYTKSFSGATRKYFRGEGVTTYKCTTDLYLYILSAIQKKKFGGGVVPPLPWFRQWTCSRSAFYTHTQGLRRSHIINSLPTFHFKISNRFIDVKYWIKKKYCIVK